MTHSDTYPNAPGHKAGAEPTSREAAERFAPKALTLRDRVFEAIRKRPITADEAAEAVGASPLVVRPRVAELKAMGRIIATGERRPSSLGAMTTVWREMTAADVRESFLRSCLP